MQFTLPGQLPASAHARIKTRQLVLLAHLDRHRSVLHAADAAGMSQPAASKLLHELEDTLGVPLFERHARGVEPTAFGLILVRHAHAVLAELRRAQDAVEALKRGDRLRVAIGSVMSPGTDLVPMALATLAAEHPRMVVGVEIDNSRPLIAKLLEGRLDVVIGRILDPDLAGELDFEPLAEEPHSLIGRVGHPLQKKRGLRMAHLVDHAWVMPPGDSVLRERLHSMFLQRGLPVPERIVETASVPLTTQLLRGSDMLVALPEAVVRPDCQAGMLCVLPIELHVRLEAFGLITRRGRVRPDDVEQVLAALRDAAGRVYRRPGVP